MSRKPYWRPTGRAIVVVVSSLMWLPVGLVGTLHANPSLVGFSKKVTGPGNGSRQCTTLDT